MTMASVRGLHPVNCSLQVVQVGFTPAATLPSTLLCAVRKSPGFTRVWNADTSPGSVIWNSAKASCAVVDGPAAPERELVNPGSIKSTPRKAGKFGERLVGRFLTAEE